MNRALAPLLVALIATACGGGEATDNAETSEPVVESTNVTTPETTTSTTTSTLADVRIPDLQYFDKSEAFKVLSDMGLEVSLSPLDSLQPVDEIVSSEPAFGSSVQPGSSVVLNFSNGNGVTRDLTVRFDIEDNLWRDLGNGKCDYPRQNIYKNQSFDLVGPDGRVLSTSRITDDGQLDKFDGRTVCTYWMIFFTIPEVDNYDLRLGDGSLQGAVSLSTLKEKDWRWGWYVFNK